MAHKGPSRSKQSLGPWQVCCVLTGAGSARSMGSSVSAGEWYSAENANIDYDPMLALSLASMWGDSSIGYHGECVDFLR